MARSPLQILFLSTWFPAPLDTGSRIRVAHLLRALAADNHVDLVSFLPEPVEEASISELRGRCRRVETVERSPFWRDPRKRFTGHLSRTPRDVIACRSPEMSALVNRLAALARYDLVIASVTNTAHYALQVRDTPRLLEEHNFDTLWMEERWRAQTALPGKLAGWITWQKCRAYERRLFPQFQAISMVSVHDRAAVERVIPSCAGRVYVCPNGVDVQRYRPSGEPPAHDTLVFNGPLAYAPNREAMRWFLGEVFPRILSERPAAQLTITGRAGGFDLNTLPVRENVTLTGYLDDIRPAVAGSWACVVPIRAGSGTRLKILEAMALGTPVITTSKGIEGIAARPGEDFLLADSAEDFACQALRLLRDSGLRARLARSGRALVEARYSWASIGASFSALAEQTAAMRPPAAVRRATKAPSHAA